MRESGIGKTTSFVATVLFSLTIVGILVWLWRTRTGKPTKMAAVTNFLVIGSQIVNVVRVYADYWLDETSLFGNIVQASVYVVAPMFILCELYIIARLHEIIISSRKLSKTKNKLKITSIASVFICVVITVCVYVVAKIPLNAAFLIVALAELVLVMSILLYVRLATSDVAKVVKIVTRHLRACGMLTICFSVGLLKYSTRTCPVVMFFTIVSDNFFTMAVLILYDNETTDVIVQKGRNTSVLVLGPTTLATTKKNNRLSTDDGISPTINNDMTDVSFVSQISFNKKVTLTDIDSITGKASNV